MLKNQLSVMALTLFAALQLNVSQAVASVFSVDVRQVHPTQFAVGYREIESRKEDIAKLSPKDYEAYLHKKVGKAVVGPGHQLWMVDGHHLARIVLELNRYDMYVDVGADWSNLSQEDFLKAMFAHHYLWLRDEMGRNRSPYELPSNIAMLKDDPYRSVAWKVSNKGGYDDDTNVLFADSMWADYFRTGIPEKMITDHWHDAVDLGLKMAQDPKAKNLPGYHGKH